LFAQGSQWIDLRKLSIRNLTVFTWRWLQRQPWGRESKKKETARFPTTGLSPGNKPRWIFFFFERRMGGILFVRITRSKGNFGLAFLVLNNGEKAGKSIDSLGEQNRELKKQERRETFWKRHERTQSA
jgi:hypothetical protein